MKKQNVKVVLFFALVIIAIYFLAVPVWKRDINYLINYWHKK